MSYNVFCKSVQGALHIKKGMPCEDFGVKYETDLCKIFALGDGHGDSNCPRSEIGSRYICEIAEAELKQFACDIADQAWTYRLFDKAEVEELVSQLVTSIIGKWSWKVNEEYSLHPLTPKECEETSEYMESYRKGERIEHIYGTTLIAGLLTKDYLLLLQQGDGRCVVFDCEGNVSQPIPWDDRCFANVTTSICDEDAVRSCRYHIIDLSKNPIIACIAGSDGVEDSFHSMDKMHVFYRNILRNACENGMEGFENYLEEYLPSFSANGSGDDTTICGLIDMEAFSGKFEKMARENEIILIKDEMARAQERIDSMTAKLQYLKEKYEGASAKYIAIENEYLPVSEKYKGIEADIDSNSTQVMVIQDNRCIDAPFFDGELDQAGREHLSLYSLRCLKKRLERLANEKEALEEELVAADDEKVRCEKEYLSYKEKYDGYVKMKEDAQGRMAGLNG